MGAVFIQSFKGLGSGGRCLPRHGQGSGCAPEICAKHL